MQNSLKDDIDSIRIKYNVNFRALNLKNIELIEVKLALPKSKYILIDYWFHKCHPRINNFPKMKEVYAEHDSKGFEIIGISVDRTKSIIK